MPFLPHLRIITDEAGAFFLCDNTVLFQDILQSLVTRSIGLGSQITFTVWRYLNMARLEVQETGHIKQDMAWLPACYTDRASIQSIKERSCRQKQMWQAMWGIRGNRKSSVSPIPQLTGELHFSHTAKIGASVSGLNEYNSVLWQRRIKATYQPGQNLTCSASPSMMHVEGPSFRFVPGATGLSVINDPQGPLDGGVSIKLRRGKLSGDSRPESRTS